MNIKNGLKTARLEYRNSRGWKLDHKYVIIESDDWGSIRQPSAQIWQLQVDKSKKTKEDPFFHYDSLERNQDLERLFEVLSKYKDHNGNHPVITADYAVANPDFVRIKKLEFCGYQYELFTETLKRYPESGKVYRIAEQGIVDGLWKPQLHCREHVQINRWLQALRDRDPEIIWAFDHQMISTAEAIETHNHYAYMDAFNYRLSDSDTLYEIICEAVRLFEDIFGFRSRTFVASCYVWNDVLEKALKTYGIEAMQGSWYQWKPSEINPGLFEKKVHHNGDRSENQLYLVRNCLFEHSLFGDEQCVERCMRQIDSAFRWNQPAIICSHRVNYIGRIIQSNGENGVKLLDELLRQILRRWPDVEFISSDRLADIYTTEVR